MGIGRRGSGSHQGPTSLRTGAGRPPSGQRAQVHGEFGDCYFNTGVSPEEGASEGSKWLLGGADLSGAGESKFLGWVAVSGFLFLLSWAAFAAHYFAHYCKAFLTASSVKAALPWVSPYCKCSLCLFSSFVSAVEVIPTIAFHTCSVLVTMLPHTDEPSHHSMEPPSGSCAGLYQKSEPRECISNCSFSLGSKYRSPILASPMAGDCYHPFSPRAFAHEGHSAWIHSLPSTLIPDQNLPISATQLSQAPRY